MKLKASPPGKLRWRNRERSDCRTNWRWKMVCGWHLNVWTTAVYPNGISCLARRAFSCNSLLRKTRMWQKQSPHLMPSTPPELDWLEDKTDWTGCGKKRMSIVECAAHWLIQLYGIIMKNAQKYYCSRKRWPLCSNTNKIKLLVNIRFVREASSGLPLISGFILAGPIFDERVSWCGKMMMIIRGKWSYTRAISGGA